MFISIPFIWLLEKGIGSSAEFVGRLVVFFLAQKKSEQRLSLLANVRIRVIQQA
jgi:hypothetical protein